MPSRSRPDGAQPAPDRLQRPDERRSRRGQGSRRLQRSRQALERSGGGGLVGRRRAERGGRAVEIVLRRGRDVRRQRRRLDRRPECGEGLSGIGEERAGCPPSIVVALDVVDVSRRAAARCGIPCRCSQLSNSRAGGAASSRSARFGARWRRCATMPHDSMISDGRDEHAEQPNDVDRRTIPDRQLSSQTAGCRRSKAYVIDPKQARQDRRCTASIEKHGEATAVASDDSHDSMGPVAAGRPAD